MELIIKIVEYIENNDLASLIVSIIALLISFLGTLFIPWWKNRKQKKQLQQELDNFKNMLKNDYVGYLFIEIDKVVNGKTDRTKTEVLNMVRENSIKLLDLKTNELIYVTSENQFKLIRMAEFAITYLNYSQRVMKFTPDSFMTNEDNTDMDKVRELRLKGLQRLRQLYESKLEKYANLEVDSLIDREEYKEMRKKIKYLEPKNKD